MVCRPCAHNSLGGGAAAERVEADHLGRLGVLVRGRLPAPGPAAGRLLVRGLRLGGGVRRLEAQAVADMRIGELDRSRPAG